MADTTIGIKLQGEDAASAQIKKVAGSLSEMGVAAQAQATNIAKGGDAVKAAMGAASGSISGAIGAVKGITTAIQGMGVAINTALPIAAAIAAAIFLIKKAYDAIQASHQAEIDKIKEETDARLKQSKAIDQAASSMRDLISHQERMAKIQLEINGGNALDQKKLEGNLLTNRGGAMDEELERRKANAADLREKMNDASYYAAESSGKKKQQYEEQYKKYAEELAKEREAIKKLTWDREYLGKQIELNAKQQNDIIKAEEEAKEAAARLQEEMQKRADAEAAATAAAEEERKKKEEQAAAQRQSEALKRAAAEADAREKQLAMLELQIKGADKSEIAKVEAQFLQKEIGKIASEKNAVAEQLKNTPLGEKYTELALLYDKLAGEEQIAIKNLEAHNAVEARRVKEEEEAEKKRKAEEEKREKTSAIRDQIKALEDEKKKQQGLAGEMKNASLFTANSHSTNLLLDKLRGAGNDSTTKEIASSTKSIDTKIQRLLDEIKKLNVA